MNAEWCLLQVAEQVLALGSFTLLLLLLLLLLLGWLVGWLAGWLVGRWVSWPAVVQRQALHNCGVERERESALYNREGGSSPSGFVQYKE